MYHLALSMDVLGTWAPLMEKGKLTTDYCCGTTSLGMPIHDVPISTTTKNSAPLLSDLMQTNTPESFFYKSDSYFLHPLICPLYSLFLLILVSSVLKFSFLYPSSPPQSVYISLSCLPSPY